MQDENPQPEIDTSSLGLNPEIAALNRIGWRLTVQGESMTLTPAKPGFTLSVVKNIILASLLVILVTLTLFTLSPILIAFSLILMGAGGSNFLNQRIKESRHAIKLVCDAGGVEVHSRTIIGRRKVRRFGYTALNGFYIVHNLEENSPFVTEPIPGSQRVREKIAYMIRGSYAESERRRYGIINLFLESGDTQFLALAREIRHRRQADEYTRTLNELLLRAIEMYSSSKILEQLRQRLTNVDGEVIAPRIVFEKLRDEQVELPTTREHFPSNRADYGKLTGTQRAAKAAREALDARWSRTVAIRHLTDLGLGAKYAEKVLAAAEITLGREPLQHGIDRKKFKKMDREINANHWTLFLSGFTFVLLAVFCLGTAGYLILDEWRWIEGAGFEDKRVRVYVGWTGSLAGSGATFLLLGLGRVAVDFRHLRRRWRSERNVFDDPSDDDDLISEVDDDDGDVILEGDAMGEIS